MEESIIQNGIHIIQITDHVIGEISKSMQGNYHTFGNSLLEDDIIDRVCGCPLCNEISKSSSVPTEDWTISILRPPHVESKISPKSSWMMTF